MCNYSLMTGIILAVCLVFPNWGMSQDLEVIELRNPSFEGIPRIGNVGSSLPSGWADCGKFKEKETAPDIHDGKDPANFFQVSQKPFDGRTYLGMVVREKNESYEAVGQLLRKPIKAGKKYKFGLHLAQSPNYISLVSSADTTKFNHDGPVRVRIWGGSNFCKKDELLSESGTITNKEWKAYEFEMSPKMTHNFILIEAFWKTPSLFPYRGNVLVDNATPIYEISQETEIAKVEPPVVRILNPERSGRKSQDNTFLIEATIKNVKSKNELSLLINGAPAKFSFDAGKGSFKSYIILVEGENKFRIKATNAGGTHQDEAVVVYSPKVAASDVPSPQPDYVLTPELKNNLLKGQKLKITNLNFQVDSYVITEEAFPALDEFANYLRVNPSVKIEIGGHTNNRCQDSFCNELSKNRAKAVADYFEKKGIANQRMTYKGYGKTEPIANNKYPEGRKKNQRVEIKIL